MNLNKGNLLYGRVIAGKGCVELGAFVHGSLTKYVKLQQSLLNARLFRIKRLSVGLPRRSSRGLGKSDYCQATSKDKAKSSGSPRQTYTKDDK